jgi:hypothetical protein
MILGWKLKNCLPRNAFKAQWLNRKKDEKKDVYALRKKISVDRVLCNSTPTRFIMARIIIGRDSYLCIQSSLSQLPLLARTTSPYSGSCTTCLDNRVQYNWYHSSLIYPNSSPSVSTPASAQVPHSELPSLEFLGSNLWLNSNEQRENCNIYH